jgi:hypothetical protein
MVIVAIVLFSLVALAALAVDTAALVQERRTLQNSADAAAMAVAQDCGEGSCGPFYETARQYARQNADDGATAVENGAICGTGTGTACPNPPTGVAGYVRVTTVTGRDETAGRVPFSFARVMGYDGQAVHAQATVAWGSPDSLSTLPLTISFCEWDEYMQQDTQDATPDPHAIYLQGTSGTERCPSGQPNGGDLPGGFGWLSATSCQVLTTSAGSWLAVDTGLSNIPCRDVIEARRNSVIHLPIYDAWNGLPGSNATYRIRGYASFFLTGFRLPSSRENACAGNGAYLCGYFVDNQLTTAPGTLGGVDMGLNLAKFVD